MKKIVVLMLALCLAVPAISHAGSATSRWDLTIGGNIKFDMGWVSSKEFGVLNASGIPGRDDRTGFESANNQYGHQIWGGGEAGLNFFVRGPDLWGAKTSAFLLMDFTGVWGGSNYGTADLLVATMTFDWANTTLMIGDAGSAFGMLPTFAGNQGAWGAVGLFGDKGAAPILSQITWTQRWTKALSSKFGIMANANNMRNQNNFPVPAATADFAAAREWTPGVQGGITYSSDACGRVGPWQLTFGTSGGYIRQKQVFTSNAAGTRVSDDDTNGWLADFKVLVPIIPQKNDGNKGGALYFDGVYWQGQNFDGFNAGFGNTGTGVYVRNNNPFDPDYAARRAYGFYTHVAYYFTDALWANAFWMQGHSPSSANFKRTQTPNPIAGTGGIVSVDQVIVSLVYDANPAVRFGVQWERSTSHFANSKPGLTDRGLQNVYRVNAYYYF